jgi:hypothetical protein
MGATPTRVVTIALTLVLAALGGLAGMHLGNAIANLLPVAVASTLEIPCQFAGVAAVFVASMYVLAPAYLRFTFAVPSERHFEMFDPAVHPLPPKDRQWIEGHEATLRDSGFERAAHVATIGPYGVSHVVLLHHRGTGAVAHLRAGAMPQVSFWTQLEHERTRITNSSVKVLDRATPPWVLQERFPGLDTGRLWAAHCALVSADEKRGERSYREDPPLVVRDPVLFMREIEERWREWNRKRGHFYVDGRERIRLTWRGAFVRTWDQISWHQARLRRKAVARAEAKLRELGV